MKTLKIYYNEILVETINFKSIILPSEYCPYFTVKDSEENVLAIIPDNYLIIIS